MKSEKPMNLDDIELLPDSMERLEGAVKMVFKAGAIPKDVIKGAVPRAPIKKPRPTRRRP
jgi:hypothetical protein